MESRKRKIGKENKDGNQVYHVAYTGKKKKNNKLQTAVNKNVLGDNNQHNISQSIT